MFIEGEIPSSSTPLLMEFNYPRAIRKNIAHSIEHDTQRIVATLESEWLTAQSPHPLVDTIDTPLNIQGHAIDNEAWQLDDNHNLLVKEGVEINLTGLEAALVRKMLHHDERVVSRDDLILSIGRQPEQYRGLEMCLSRLQDKFKSASNGERLFRAVRNRGYCLIQQVVSEQPHA